MTLIIQINVVPSSGRQKAILNKSGILKIYLKNPPKRGKANIELIKLLSKRLKIPQTQISIISGAISRKKHVKIEAEITKEKLYTKLGIHLQMSI